MSQQNINVKGAAEGQRNRSLKDKSNVLNFKNGTLTVNDIFYSSWGYEQTNICFYQVVAVKGKTTVTVRKIRGNETALDGSMTGKVTPVMNDFLEESFDRRVKDCASVPMIVIDDCEYAYKAEPGRIYRFSFYG